MDFTTLGMLALIGVAAYFLLIRPQQKRAAEQRKAMDAIGPGDRVMTLAGIIGTIKYLGDKQAILEISPGVEMTIDKRALSAQPVEDEFEYADDEEPHLKSRPEQVDTDPADDDSSETKSN